MQLVWPYEVFCLLCNVALLVGWNEFGRNGGIYDVEEGLSGAVIFCALCHPVDQMADKCLRHRGIDAVHRHVVAVVGGPSKCQFAEVACTHDEAVHLVGSIHENLCPLASLTVLVGDVVLVCLVPDVGKVLQASLLDADFADGNAQELHEVDGIGVGAVCRAEARHCDAHHSAAVQAELVEGADADEQGKRGVKATTDAKHYCLCTSVLNALR